MIGLKPKVSDTVIDRTTVMLRLLSVFLGVVFGVPQGAAYNALVSAGALLLVLAVFWGAKFIFQSSKKLLGKSIDRPSNAEKDAHTNTDYQNLDYVN